MIFGIQKRIVINPNVINKLKERGILNGGKYSTREFSRLINSLLDKWLKETPYGLE